MDHAPPPPRRLPVVLSTPIPSLTVTDHKNFFLPLLKVHLFLGFLWDLAARLSRDITESYSQFSFIRAVMCGLGKAGLVKLFSNFLNDSRMRELRDRSSVLLKIILNPSFTSLLVPTPFTKGEERGSAGPPAISKTVVPMNVKFFWILETYMNVLEMLKLFT